MESGLTAVYNVLKKDTPLLDKYCFIYYDINQMLTEETEYEILSAVEGIYPIDPLAPDYDAEYAGVPYVDYTISNDRLEIILTDRNINVSHKYNATIDNTFTSLYITKHTTSVIGTDTYDTIRIINVPSACLPSSVVPATVIHLVLVNGIFITSRPFEVSNFVARKNCLFAGESLDIQLSTKFDKTRIRVNEYENRLMQIIMRNHRKFDIYDTSVPPEKVGYYKLVDIPRKNSFINSGDNVQQITISLDGYYIVYYKCMP